jgi:hypothetical protein
MSRGQQRVVSPNAFAQLSRAHWHYSHSRLMDGRQRVAVLQYLMARETRGVDAVYITILCDIAGASTSSAQHSAWPLRMECTNADRPSMSRVYLLRVVRKQQSFGYINHRRTRRFHNKCAYTLASQDLRRYRTASECPALQASMRGVMPLLSCASTLAPDLNSASMQGTLPMLALKCMGER